MVWFDCRSMVDLRLFKDSVDRLKLTDRDEIRWDVADHLSGSRQYRYNLLASALGDGGLRRIVGGSAERTGEIEARNPRDKNNGPRRGKFGQAG